MPSDGRPNLPGPQGPTHGPAYRDHRQANAALALRLAGASYTEIADALVMASPDVAREAVETVLANQVLENPDINTLREEEGMRLLRLLRGLWAKATDPNDEEHLHAIRVAVNIIDRRIRLFGLDQPTKIEIYNPAEEEINAWIGQVTHERLGAIAAIEATVVGAE
jgi:hypothetical protein